MRLWLLVGLAAALTLVAVARADPGDSTEVEDAVGEREDRLRVRREDRKRKPPPSQPCPGCYSPLSKPDKPMRGRRQVEKQQQPRRRLRPESTWRSGSLIPIKKEVDRLRVRREDKPAPKLRSKFCPGCYTPLRQPATPVRVRRQVEKQQRPRPRPRPGSLSLLRPAKVEVQESEGRTRREIERRPQPRPGPSPNPPGRSDYNYGYLSGLAGSTGKRIRIDPERQVVERRGKVHSGEAQSQAESERLTLRCWLRFQPHTAGPDGSLERGGGRRIKGD